MALPFHRLHMQDPIIDPVMVGKNVGYSVNKFEILSVEPFGCPDPLTWESTRLASASPFAGVCCNFGTRPALPSQKVFDPHKRLPGFQPSNTETPSLAAYRRYHRPVFPTSINIQRLTQVKGTKIFRCTGHDGFIIVMTIYTYCSEKEKEGKDIGMMT